MVYFLVDDFDIKIDANALPTSAIEETISEETVRIQVVGRLLDEFKDNFDDPLGEPFGMEEEGPEGYAYVKTIDVFYFCLNRTQRQPSNLNRGPSVKTAKEQRDEDWKVHIEERSYIGKESVVMENDSGVSAAIEANSRPKSPVRQTQMVLERNTGGFDVRIEARLPRPLDLIPVDRQNYSEHLLLKVNELHSNRYREVLERHSTVDICAELENNLAPGVRLVSDGGLFSLDGLRSIGGDIKTTAAGIYMHILWPPNDPQHFCLGEAEGQNLSRTLTAKDLDTYLPPSADRSSADRHLNVVPPIWQRFHDENLPARKEVFDRAGFEALIRSDDPAVRSWARQATASYNDLRNSPDPRLRRYWFENNQRQLQQAWDINEKRAIDRMKVYQVEGKERTIRCAPGRDRGYFTCGKFNIPLPQSLSMSPDSKIFVQFHLYEIAVSHRYASEAMPCDPASRLAISIKGYNSSGNEVDEWIQSSGSKAAMKINTLVDMLEGITLTETRSFCRRWDVSRTEKGAPRKTNYTNE
ncbi:hypothetical protein HAV15_003623 [Penicillium sp. str. |nr:hypothetical protein HAV15_003623 [Penicillium sp. str. \